MAGTTELDTHRVQKRGRHLSSPGKAQGRKSSLIEDAKLCTTWLALAKWQSACRICEYNCFPLSCHKYKSPLSQGTGLSRIREGCSGTQRVEIQLFAHTPALHAHWPYTATPYPTPTPSLPIPFVFLFLFQAFLPAHNTVTRRKSSVCTSPCRWCICKVKIPQVAFSLFIFDPSQPAWFSGKGPGRYK